MRKGTVVVLVALTFSVTAYAFSSVAQKTWHSRLEKGEYRGTEEFSSVFVIVAIEEEAESTPSDVIISEPVQVFAATPDEIDVENTGEETEEIEVNHNEETDPAS